MAYELFVLILFICKSRLNAKLVEWLVGGQRFSFPFLFIFLALGHTNEIREEEEEDSAVVFVLVPSQLLEKRKGGGVSASEWPSLFFLCLTENVLAPLSSLVRSGCRSRPCRTGKGKLHMERARRTTHTVQHRSRHRRRSSRMVVKEEIEVALVASYIDTTTSPRASERATYVSESVIMSLIFSGHWLRLDLRYHRRRRKSSSSLFVWQPPLLCTRHRTGTDS